MPRGEALQINGNQRGAEGYEDQAVRNHARQNWYHNQNYDELALNRRHLANDNLRSIDGHREQQRGLRGKLRSIKHSADKDGRSARVTDQAILTLPAGSGFQGL